MIKLLKIQNFQSHKDSSLDFNKGVNVIVGESDSGKSAILRALRWLIWNRPTGDAMRSNWGGRTEVEIFTDDAHVVRVRDKENEYILGGSHFKAVSTDVPDEVVQVLNVNDINLQTQLSQPFLLSDTAGEVAQFFNKVAKLDKIDKGIANVNSAIRSLEQDIKYKTAEVKDQEEQLKSFDYLEAMEKDVVHLEKMNELLDITTAERAELKHLTVGISNTTSGIEYYSELLSLEKDVDLIMSKHKEKIDKTIERNSVLKLYNAIKENEAKLNQQEKLLKLEEDVLTILDLKEDLHLLTDKSRIISKLLDSIDRYNIQLKRKVSEIDSMEAEFEEEMGDTCKLCGQTIKHKHNERKR